MNYTSTQIADQFIELSKTAGHMLTHMQVQKLVYISHGLSLAINGAPLIKDNVEAWPFGPVIPVLYKELRKYKKNQVKRVHDKLVYLDEISKLIIERVYSKYGTMSGWKLSNITHEPSTPWSETWDGGKGRFDVIDNDLIQEHYLGILNISN